MYLRSGSRNIYLVKRQQSRFDFLAFFPSFLKCRWLWRVLSSQSVQLRDADGPTSGRRFFFQSRDVVRPIRVRHVNPQSNGNTPQNISHSEVYSISPKCPYSSPKRERNVGLIFPGIPLPGFVFAQRRRAYCIGLDWTVLNQE